MASPVGAADDGQVMTGDVRNQLSAHLPERHYPDDLAIAKMEIGAAGADALVHVIKPDRKARLFFFG